MALPILVASLEGDRVSILLKGYRSNEHLLILSFR